MFTPPRGCRYLTPGTILYLQDCRPFRPIEYPVCRNPWMILAWHNRECGGLHYRGGHLATVKSLRTGEVRLVADWIIRAAEDAGLERYDVPRELHRRRAKRRYRRLLLPRGNLCVLASVPAA